MKNRFSLLVLAAGVLLCGFAATEAQAGTVSVTKDGGSFNWSLTSDGGGNRLSRSRSALFSSPDQRGSNLARPHRRNVRHRVNVLSSRRRQCPGPAPVWVFTMTAREHKALHRARDRPYGTCDKLQLSRTDRTPFAATAVSWMSPGNVHQADHDDRTHLSGSAAPLYDFSISFGDRWESHPAIQPGRVRYRRDHQRWRNTYRRNRCVHPSVPEPASLALLGIGMTGFLAFRRFFKKTSVA